MLKHRWMPIRRRAGKKGSQGSRRGGRGCLRAPGTSRGPRHLPQKHLTCLSQIPRLRVQSRRERLCWQREPGRSRPCGRWWMSASPSRHM